MADARLLRGLPAGASGNGADDILGPLIPQVTEPERDRILAALGVRVRDLPITRDRIIAAMELTS